MDNSRTAVQLLNTLNTSDLRPKFRRTSSAQAGRWVDFTIRGDTLSLTYGPNPAEGIRGGRRSSLNKVSRSGSPVRPISAIRTGAFHAERSRILGERTSDGSDPIHSPRCIIGSLDRTCHPGKFRRSTCDLWQDRDYQSPRDARRVLRIARLRVWRGCRWDQGADDIPKRGGTVRGYEADAFG